MLMKKYLRNECKYSEEGFSELFNKIKRTFGLKPKTKGDYLASFNLVKNIFGSNFEEKITIVSEKSKDITDLLKDQHKVIDEIMRNVSEIYIAMVDQEEYSTKVLDKLKQNLKDFQNNDLKIKNKMEKAFGLDMNDIKALSKIKESSKDYSSLDKLNKEAVIKPINDIINIGSRLNVKELYEVYLLFSDTYLEMTIPFIIEDDDNGVITNETLDLIETSSSKLAFCALYNLLGCAWAVIYTE